MSEGGREGGREREKETSKRERERVTCVQCGADCQRLVVKALEGTAAEQRVEAMEVGGCGSVEQCLEALNQELEGKDRRASYVCSMAFVLPDGRSVAVEDHLSGKLVWPPRCVCLSASECGREVRECGRRGSSFLVCGRYSGHV